MSPCRINQYASQVALLMVHFFNTEGEEAKMLVFLIYFKHSWKKKKQMKKHCPEVAPHLFITCLAILVGPDPEETLPMLAIFLYSCYIA